MQGNFNGRQAFAFSDNASETGSQPERLCNKGDIMGCGSKESNAIMTSCDRIVFALMSHYERNPPIPPQRDSNAELWYLIWC